MFFCCAELLVGFATTLYPRIGPLIDTSGCHDSLNDVIFWAVNARLPGAVVGAAINILFCYLNSIIILAKIIMRDNVYQ